MQSINSRSELKTIINRLVQVYNAQGTDAFIHLLYDEVLAKKVRFPLLEFAGVELHKAIPASSILTVTDAIVQLRTIGGNVLAGIILQQRLTDHFNESVNKAAEYICIGNQWYVCDIIGERVMGHALLTQPQKTIPLLKQMATNEDKWLVRCIGVATHYAVKKGVNKQYVIPVFDLLLGLASTTEFHTKKGIGWGAKTIAKFYPDIIENKRHQLDNDPEIKQWFKTKIKIGLGRTSKYASRYSS